mmetsp:Transcript_27376/g.91038  ORF Transcript_27376/g.91038 Transcript_27376/m.91038 type:complete len:86 (+) Transcript_27376:423-680(+)
MPGQVECGILTQRSRSFGRLRVTRRNRRRSLACGDMRQGQSRSFLLWCLLLCAVAWTDAGVRHEQAAVLGTNYPLCLLRWRCWLL